jgi:fumarylacetoacetase
MMRPVDQTHDPALTSWVETANDRNTDFPIQNLPFGVFRRMGSDESPRGGVAIGDAILDLEAVHAKHPLPGGARIGSTLNRLLAEPPAVWRELRIALSGLLREGGPAEEVADCLVPRAEAEMFVPAAIGDFTDFYASVNHATNAGKMFRPDNPLLPNYKWVPIAYHGRASSIVPSGTPVRRPVGQLKRPDDSAPHVGPSARIDYELELAAWVGPGNVMGSPVPLAQAEDHLFGLSILNDWSARDVQVWEYQPLGPFLAKSFASTVSPWILTLEALAPFRCPAYARPAGDPRPLDYLSDPANEAAGAFDIKLEVSIASARMRSAGIPPMRLGLAPFKEMYWTFAQMVAHHTLGGCNLRPGDLLGSGTCSGTTPDSYGSLLEVTAGGREPVELPSGEKRAFLQDGDEVVMRAFCEADGARRIGFGDCRAVIQPAR